MATFGLLRGAGAAFRYSRGGSSSGSGSSAGGGRSGAGSPSTSPRLTTPTQPAGGTPPTPGAASGPVVRAPATWTEGFAEFGRRIGWGSKIGAEEARRRAQNVTMETLEELGVTRQEAERMLAEYRAVLGSQKVRVTPDGPSNPSIEGRIAFMEEIVRRLGGEPGGPAAAPAAGPAAAPAAGPSSGARPTVSSPLIDSLRSGRWMAPFSAGGGAAASSPPQCPPGTAACVRATADAPNGSGSPAYNPDTNTTTILQFGF